MRFNYIIDKKITNLKTYAKKSNIIKINYENVSYHFLGKNILCFKTQYQYNNQSTYINNVLKYFTTTNILPLPMNHRGFVFLPNNVKNSKVLFSLLL